MSSSGACWWGWRDPGAASRVPRDLPRAIPFRPWRGSGRTSQDGGFLGFGGPLPERGIFEVAQQEPVGLAENGEHGSRVVNALVRREAIPKWEALGSPESRKGRQRIAPGFNPGIRGFPPKRESRRDGRESLWIVRTLPFTQTESPRDAIHTKRSVPDTGTEDFRGSGIRASGSPGAA